MKQPAERKSGNGFALANIEKRLGSIEKARGEDGNQFLKDLEEICEDAREIPDLLERADALGMVAGAWENAEKTGYALDLYLEALETVEKSGKPGLADKARLLTADLNMKIGYIYLFKSAIYDEALARFLESSRIFGGIHHLEGCVRALSAAGYVQREMRNFKEALDYFRMAVEKGKKSEDPACTVSALNEIGNVFMMLGDHDSSELYRRRALDLAREAGSDYMVGFITHDLGCMFLDQGKAAEALKCFEDSLEVEQDNREKSIVYHNIASVHKELGNIELAADYAARSLGIAEDAGYDPGVEQSLNLISTLAYNRGDFREACDALNRAVEIKEKIFDKERMRQAAELQMQYDVEKKEAIAEVYRLRNVELADANTRIEKQKKELEKTLAKLKKARDEVKVLGGLLPICAECKKIRDDQGFWQRVEVYIKERSDAEFTHGICPECIEKLYPTLNTKMKKRGYRM